METRSRRGSTILVCAVLILAVAAGAAGQEPPGSVLSRLQTVDDPELGELIRVAIDNYRRVYTHNPDEEIQIIRDVTESYARINLLDHQIEQTDQRIEQMMGEVRQEMILARAELESKRTVELAKLRQVMRIVPVHAFGRRSVDQLKAWLVLDVLDDRSVAVYEVGQPFSERTRNCLLTGVMPSAKALDHVAAQLEAADRLPIRIDIERTTAGIDLSNDLERDVIALVRKTSRQMQAETHLNESVARLSQPELFTLRDLVGTSSGLRNGLPYVSGTIDPNDIPAHIEGLLSVPGRLPATIELNYDPARPELVDHLTRIITETAERLGIARLVQVKPTPNPLAIRLHYLGTWQAAAREETIRISILRNERAEVLELDGARVTRRVNGRWSLENNRVIVTLGDEILTGWIDEAGSLVLQGGDEAITFEKTGD